MSELKEHRFIGTDELFHDANAGDLYYEKSEADREIRKQKRKRCLALAKIASDNWHIHNSFYAMGKMDFEQKKCERYERHRLKWLAIADKFKEA